MSGGGKDEKKMGGREKCGCVAATGLLCKVCVDGLIPKYHTDHPLDELDLRALLATAPGAKKTPIRVLSSPSLLPHSRPVPPSAPPKEDPLADPETRRRLLRTLIAFGAPANPIPPTNSHTNDDEEEEEEDEDEDTGDEKEDEMERLGRFRDSLSAALYRSLPTTASSSPLSSTNIAPVHIPAGYNIISYDITIGGGIVQEEVDSVSSDTGHKISLSDLGTIHITLPSNHIPVHFNLTKSP